MTRGGKKKSTFSLDKKVVMRLKVYSAITNQEQSILVEEAITSYLDQVTQEANSESIDSTIDEHGSKVASVVRDRIQAQKENEPHSMLPGDVEIEPSHSKIPGDSDE